MRRITLIFCLSLLIYACGSRKKSGEFTDNKPVETDVSDQIDDLNDSPAMDLNGAITTEGTIRDKTEEGCSFLVEISQDNETRLFEPLQLDTNFLVEGMAVTFTYRLSRRPSTCVIALPIVIDSIWLNKE